LFVGHFRGPHDFVIGGGVVVFQRSAYSSRIKFPSPIFYDRALEKHPRAKKTFTEWPKEWCARRELNP
ncbi:MAG: hypothetical protein WCS94_20105, partial [Verrucomicrobiota bacterium]